MRLRTLMLTIAALILFTGTSSSYAQELAPPAADPIEKLRLTPDQRQKIRLIFQENKDERQVTNRRLREANVALELALDAESIDENLIDQRINELAAAQAAQLRMRIRMELNIRRQLRPEQLAIWRTLRLQLKDFAGAQRSDQPPAGQNLRPNRGSNSNTLAPGRNIPRP
ncbi:MAG TPA: periplasmic heavy metal sensor [Pyrinomonadaceae bacterium]|nr:periplasmic heavy metal sensor [Pyrinomonadaceae bacterium]